MNDFIDYLETLSNLGISPSLGGIECLAKIMGDPQSEYDSIQITGTNGKTSTSKFLASILSNHQRKCGLYLSPHLQHYNERWSIDGDDISYSRLAEVGKVLRDWVDKADIALAPRRITQFEVLTGFAILYFHLEKVDVAVFEVGMGGKWDATSVVKPAVSALTTISMDHSDYLGDSIEAIAKEKSHVLKVGTKAVAGRVDDSVKKILTDRAEDQNGEIYFLGDDYKVSARDVSGRVRIDGIFAVYNGLDTRGISKYQIDNLAVAVAAAELYLNEALSIEGIRRSLDQVKLVGRAELISYEPRILLDGAHNEAGSIALGEVLRDEYKFDKLILVLSMLRDKDLPKVLKNLLPLAGSVVATCNHNPRSLSAKELQDIIIDSGHDAALAGDMKSAISNAMEQAGDGDLICVTGSLYGVGEARDALQ